MTVPLLDLKAQYTTIKEEVIAAIGDVLERQHFILGKEVEELETKIAEFCCCKYALGVSSGTDALLLGLMALNIGHGDYVITTSFSFFATAGCIVRLGAVPVFVDVDPYSFNMDPAKLERVLVEMSPVDRKKVKAVIVVHLFGQMAEMASIQKICDHYEVPVIEDAAQAIGSEYVCDGKIIKSGCMGSLGCFSFFPSKNLGGYGDGGMITTNDEKLYNFMKILRVHGSKPKYYHKYVGGNFRLDEIQAAVLNVKFKYLNQWNNKRKENARFYDTQLESLDGKVLTLPKVVKGSNLKNNFHIFNQYCIVTKKRDELMQHLKEKGIGHEIYYPVPLHLQECFEYLGYKQGDFPVSEMLAGQIVAIPIYPELGEENIQFVSRTIQEFFDT